MFQVILNANSIVQYIIQIKNGMKKHVNVPYMLKRLWLESQDMYLQERQVCKNHSK